MRSKLLALREWLPRGVWKALTAFAKAFWFREGTVRRSFAGPRSGIIFEMSPAMRNRRYVLYDAYEESVEEKLVELMRPGTTLFDVGAHVGIHALHAAKLLSGQGQVHAFEAWPDNFRSLEANVGHNHHLKTKVVTHQVAVGASVQASVLMAEGRTDGTHHLSRPGEVSSFEVEMTTLDAFVEKNQSVPDVVLIDTEGAELDVLNGSISLAKKHEPHFIVELHGADMREGVMKWMGDHSYCVEEIDANHIWARRTD